LRTVSIPCLGNNVRRKGMAKKAKKPAKKAPKKMAK
jgi:hypothetical protein